MKAIDINTEEKEMNSYRKVASVTGMGLGGWLIVKGFNPKASASQSAKTAPNEKSSTREVRMASSKIA